MAPQTAGQTPGPAPRATGVTASGVDVSVALAAESSSSSPFGVVVWNAACGELGRSTAWPVVGVTGVAVPAVLGQVLGTCGVQYEVRLEDSTGAAVGEALPFRVGLACTGAQCEFTVTAGLSADGAVALSAALDGAMTAQAGAADLVAAVAAASPALRDASYSLALEVDRELDAQGLTPGPQCHCLWAGVVDVTGQAGALVPPHRRAWSCGSHLSDGDLGETGLAARRLCFTAGQASSGQPQTLLLPGGQTWPTQPLRRCVPTHPKAEQATFTVAGRLTVEAGGDPGVGATATATVDVTKDGVAVGPSSVLAAASEAGDPSAPSVWNAFDSGPTVASGVTVATGAFADLSPSGTGGDGRAFAAVALELVLDVPFEALLSIRNPQLDTEFGGPDPVPCRDSPQGH